VRVLQVNKFLYGGAGAETVMFRTADLLRANGHDVNFFAMDDPRNVPCDDSRYFPRGRYYGGGHGLLDQARSAAASIYSVDARKSLRRLLKVIRPDVAHLHNIYHQLTLSVVDELVAQGIPTVMTVHDYKPVCPSYLAYTDHAPCRRCVTGHPGHVIAHRCIKNSRAASTVAAGEALLTRTRRLYQRIDAFIVPSKHCMEVLVLGGLPAERMHLIPNFVADDQLRPFGESSSPRAAMALFVGRLEEAKGIDVLLAAARSVAAEIQVVVVGEGPLQGAVRDADRAGSVSYLGRRQWHEIAPLMDEACALVVPSLWEENCPMVVLEAGARGCPVIASDRGGLTELVSHERDGLLFPAGQAGGLADALLRLGRDLRLSERLGTARRVRIETTNTAKSYLESLMRVYSCNLS
jgi:glycosyltransferase involved in cell wall biosynthesis